MTTTVKEQTPSDSELRAKLKKMVVKNRRLDMIEERTLEMLADTEVLVVDDLLREKEAEKSRQTITYTELWVRLGQFVSPSTSERGGVIRVLVGST